MLKINNLTVSVDNKIILKDFSLNVEVGSVNALMGPNGIGKSTICKVIMGDPNYKVLNGSIIYKNQDLLSLTTDERSRKGIFLLSQNPIEIEGVTNADLLRAALECRTNEYVNFFEFNKQVTAVCKKLNIDPSFIHRGVNEGMSGGEKKKNEMLHLFILKPDLVILDELDSGLDVDSLALLSAAIKEYKNENQNVSVLFITHHISIMNELKPDKVHIITDGKIVKTGGYDLAVEIENNGFNSYKGEINE